jgi:hypothetical protein
VSLDVVVTLDGAQLPTRSLIAAKLAPRRFLAAQLASGGVPEHVVVFRCAELPTCGFLAPELPARGFLAPHLHAVSLDVVFAVVDALTAPL